MYMSDLTKTISLASRMFSAISDGTADYVEQRARFYRLLPGIDFPSDWDELDLDEKTKRLDQLDQIAAGN